VTFRAAQLLTLLWTLPVAVQAQYNYITNNNEITITGYTGPGGAVTIPGSIDGLRVTRINSDAFSDRTNLTSVTIPQSIINAGDPPFARCFGLTAINVEASNESYSSAGGVLLNKSQTEFIRYPGGKAGDYTVPNGIGSILFSAFSDSPGITSVTNPGSVTNIGSFAFANCSNLTSVYFLGDRPRASLPAVFTNTPAIIYFLPGTATWGPVFVGRPTVLWRPIMQTISAQGIPFGFTINWASDRAVVVEACTNLPNPIWTSVKTNTLIDGSAYFNDQELTKFSTRFYRLREY
jgi:hypothetical protein